jgi:hypothetical protein
LTRTPEQLFTAAAPQLAELVEGLRAQLRALEQERRVRPGRAPGPTDAGQAHAGQAESIRSWCQSTTRLCDPTWWASARQAHNADQAAAQTTGQAKRTARTAAAGAAHARALAAEQHAIHHRNHPPSRF